MRLCNLAVGIGLVAGVCGSAILNEGAPPRVDLPESKPPVESIPGSDNIAVEPAGVAEPGKVTIPENGKAPEAKTDVGSVDFKTFVAKWEADGFQKQMSKDYGKGMTERYPKRECSNQRKRGILGPILDTFGVLSPASAEKWRRAPLRHDFNGPVRVISVPLTWPDWHRVFNAVAVSLRNRPLSTRPLKIILTGAGVGLSLGSRPARDGLDAIPRISFMVPKGTPERDVDQLQLAFHEVLLSLGLLGGQRSFPADQIKDNMHEDRALDPIAHNSKDTVFPGDDFEILRMWPEFELAEMMTHMYLWANEDPPVYNPENVMDAVAVLKNAVERNGGRLITADHMREVFALTPFADEADAIMAKTVERIHEYARASGFSGFDKSLLDLAAC